MAHLKQCPYGAHSHRMQSAFKRCERANRPMKWKKSPK